MPGVPDFQASDWSLTVKDAGGRVLRRVALGRRSDDWNKNRGGWAHTWKAAEASPDGRYIAVRAADDTLRLLDLGVAE
jgi:hypothetical protein